MPRTSNPLTITIPKGMSRRIRREADKRNMTVSGLLRTSFEAFVKESPDIYTDKELAALLQRDRIPTKLQKDLDTLLGR
jgi:16S rRNA U516 pseudouridylate synthase RsuA-like enzyme